MSKKEIIKGYKGFNKDLTCNGYQYKEGELHIHKGKVEKCNSGFHFCENPIDCFSYYKPTQSVFYEIEASGDIDKEKNGDSKVSCSELKVGGKLSIEAMVKASVEFIWQKASTKKIFSKTSATSGNRAHSATSGEYAHSATSGNRANSATSGYGAHSATKTSDAIACAIGRKSKAKASVGSFIVLAEWNEDNDLNKVHPICVKSVKVDGKKIKGDTWYKLVGGKFIETDGSNE